METSVLQVVSRISQTYFKNMFGLDVKPVKENAFKMSDRPAFKSELIAFIGLAGQHHQGQIVLGLSKKFAEKMVSRFSSNVEVENREEFVMSAIGEFLNSLGGRIGSEESLAKAYPELSQTLPIINDTTEEGSVYFTKSDGGTVQFSCDGETIYAYISLKAFPA